MLQIISPKDSKIILENNTPQKNIDMVKEHIKLCNCEHMTVDITRLNLMDACMVSTLCSAEHYVKYPQGQIKWIVNTKDVENFTSDMGLGNNKFIY